MITLQWKYIKYDIDLWTWKNSEFTINEEIPKHMAQTDGTDGNKNFVLKATEKAIAHLKELLDERINRVIGDATNVLTNTNEWKFELNEGNYLTDTSVLASLMHAYVVKSILADWSKIFAPQHTATLYDEAGTLATDIVNAAYKKKMPTKKLRELCEDNDNVIVEAE